jgi:hypothetical protein
MSSLLKVLLLSITVACTMGLEPLMFPTGLTEVMVTPLEPPRLGPPLGPDLLLGLDLCEVLRLLDLPTCTHSFTNRVRCSCTLIAANRVLVPQIARNPARFRLPPRWPEGISIASAIHKAFRAASYRKIASALEESCAKRGAAFSRVPRMRLHTFGCKESTRLGSGAFVTTSQRICDAP